MPDCAHCGTPLAEGSRFCGECGRPTGADGAGDTVVAPLLVRRWPPDPLVLLAGLLVVGGLVLAVDAEWAWALVAVLGGLVVLLAREDLQRRRAVWALTDLRLRVAATREAMAARSREQIELFRAHRELAELEAERDRLFRDLGAAEYGEDATAAAAVRTGLDGVVERIRAKAAEIETLRRESEARVARAQAHVRPTDKLDADDPAS